MLYLSIRNGFRPLDGESISKLKDILSHKPQTVSFRPLDGESISKPFRLISRVRSSPRNSFRPLDGESISKHSL